MTFDNPILSKSGSGWCKVHIGDFTGNASYLTDVAFDFLYTFKQWIDNKCIPVIFCDEEGSEFRIIIEEMNIYIIHEKLFAKLYTIECNRVDFVLQVLKDIENNLDFFAKEFCDYEELDADELLQRKIDILNDIKYIKENIEEFE